MLLIFLRHRENNHVNVVKYAMSVFINTIKIMYFNTYAHCIVLPVLLLKLFFHPPQVYTKAYAENIEVQHFIKHIVKKHSQLDTNKVTNLFKTVFFDKVALEKKQNASTYPPTWKQYKDVFLNTPRIEEGVVFWKKHKNILEYAQNHYGVPARIILAILGVETYYSQKKGDYRVIDALTTLSFELKNEISVQFFKKELENLLLLHYQFPKLNLSAAKGSYAGAIGIPQFMPSSYQTFAVDYHQKGYSDLNNVEDAICSVANYLKKNGWKKNQSVALAADIRKANPHQLKSFFAHNTLMTSAKSLREWKKYGIELKAMNIKLPIETKATLICLQDDTAETEYWLGFSNLKVLYTYNRLTVYGMTVEKLSQALEKEYNKGAHRHAISSLL